jgi:hypothetical protein
MLKTCRNLQFFTDISKKVRIFAGEALGHLTSNNESKAGCLCDNPFRITISVKKQELIRQKSEEICNFTATEKLKSCSKMSKSGTG